VSAFLLDVNVLIALVWPEHSGHRLVQRWFARTGGRRWATCPFTEAGFVRILSNPAFSPRAVSPVEAIEALRANTGRPGHEFWSDDARYGEAVQSFQARIVGHQQVSDAYLVGLALRKRGRLATLDRGILDLLHEHPDQDIVELIAG